MMSMMYFVLICYTGPVKINKYILSVWECHFPLEYYVDYSFDWLVLFSGENVIYF